MATLSVAARNAALDAIVALLETGATQAGPSFISRGNPGAAALHNTFFCTTSPSKVTTFNPAASGVASKTTLPWAMSLVSTFAANLALHTLTTWEINSRTATLTISGTWGATGSGEDIELPAADLLVIRGNAINFSQFDLVIA